MRIAVRLQCGLQLVGESHSLLLALLRNLHSLPRTLEFGTKHEHHIDLIEILVAAAARRCSLVVIATAMKTPYVFIALEQRWHIILFGSHFPGNFAGVQFQAIEDKLTYCLKRLCEILTLTSSLHSHKSVRQPSKVHQYVGNECSSRIALHRAKNASRTAWLPRGGFVPLHPLLRLAFRKRFIRETHTEFAFANLKTWVKRTTWITEPTQATYFIYFDFEHSFCSKRQRDFMRTQIKPLLLLERRAGLGEIETFPSNYRLLNWCWFRHFGAEHKKIATSFEILLVYTDWCGLFF